MVVTGTEPAPALPSPAGAAATDIETTPRRFELIGAGIAVVIGVALRFWTTSHLWLDEALTVDIARLPLGDIPGALRHDGHPPLYYFLLHGWISLFGEGDVAVRSLSGLFGVIAIPLAWYAGRRAGGRYTALATVALLSLSPFAIRYATETRMYSMVMCLVFAGYLLVSNALERTTRPRLIGIALVTGALLLSHYWAMWLIGSAVLVLAWRAWRRQGDDRKVTVRVLIAIIAGGIFLVPWLGVMLYQSAHTGTPWAPPIRPAPMITYTLQDFGGGGYGEAQLFGLAVAVLFLIGVFARATDRRRLEVDIRTIPTVRREATVIALTMAVASVAGYATRTTFATRYAAVIIPLFLLVVAVGLSRFLSPVARGCIAAFVLVLGLVGGIHTAITDRTQTGEITDIIRAEAQPGDIVLICPDQLGPATHRQLPDRLGLQQLSYPTLGDPALVDWRDYEKRNAAVDPVAVADQVIQRARGAHNVWLVDSGGYKTLEGQCESVEQEFGTKLGPPNIRILEDGGKFFEHASLIQYPGAP